MNIHLRHFNDENDGDVDFISQKLYPGMAPYEVPLMIDEWNTLQYKGSYFEAFAIETDEGLTGYVSLYEKVKGTVNIGVVIIPEYQRKGIAYQTLTEIFLRLKEYGCLKAAARVRKDNIPSLKLCEKAGFTITGESLSARDNKTEVYSLEKLIK